MLLHKVSAFIREHGLLDRKDRVLVACSGGPDSTALFHLLRAIAPSFDLDLVIAHLNHGIRTDAGEDEAFVRALAEDAGVSLVAEAADCPALSREWRVSLEGAARRARYAFLDRQAHALGITKVALGHTADDQAETILMRLLRGSGLRGLAGISPVRRARGIQYIRPLLVIPKGDILAFLASQSIPYRTDTTNTMRCCTRNRIRLDLMPCLEKEFNPSLVQTLSRTAELLREDDLALSHFASLLLDRVAVERGTSGWKSFLSPDTAGTGDLEVRCAHLTEQPVGLQRRLLQEALARYTGVPQGAHFEHVASILRMINAPQGGGQVDVPGGVTVCRDGDSLRFTRRARRKEGAQGGDENGRAGVSSPIPLKIPGTTCIPALDCTLHGSVLPRGEIAGIPPPPGVAFLDYDTLPKPLMIRTRHPGDRFHPLGVKGEKRLKEFFIDQKVPKRLRDAWPLVVGNGHIIWVLGLRIAHPYRMGPGTTRVLRLSFDL